MTVRIDAHRIDPTGFDRVHAERAIRDGLAALGTPPEAHAVVTLRGPTADGVPIVRARIAVETDAAPLVVEARGRYATGALVALRGALLRRAAGRRVGVAM